MKRFPILLLALMLALTACGNPAPESAEEQPPVQEETVAEETSQPEEEAPEEEKTEEPAEETAQQEGNALPEGTSQPPAQADTEQQAAAKAGTEQQDAAKAGTEQQAAAKAEAERQAAAKAEAERQAALEKEQQREESVKVSGENFLPDVEEEIIELINDMREEKGLSPLTYNKNLQKAARIRSKELYDNNYFAHTRPNGDSWDTVLSEDVPTPNSGRGENLAMARSSYYARQRTASEWVEQWANSPGHYANMMQEDFTHIGLGVYYQIEDNGSYSAYATTLFGIL